MVEATCLFCESAFDPACRRAVFHVHSGLSMLSISMLTLAVEAVALQSNRPHKTLGPRLVLILNALRGALPRSLPRLRNRAPFQALSFGAWSVGRLMYSSALGVKN